MARVTHCILHCQVAAWKAFMVVLYILSLGLLANRRGERDSATSFTSDKQTRELAGENSAIPLLSALGGPWAAEHLGQTVNAVSLIAGSNQQSVMKVTCTLVPLNVSSPKGVFMYKGIKIGCCSLTASDASKKKLNYDNWINSFFLQLSSLAAWKGIIWYCEHLKFHSILGQYEFICK